MLRLGTCLLIIARRNITQVSFIDLTRNNCYVKMYLNRTFLFIVCAFNLNNLTIIVVVTCGFIYVIGPLNYLLRDCAFSKTLWYNYPITIILLVLRYISLRRPKTLQYRP